MQFIIDHPGLFVSVLACCWPSPIAVGLAVFLARRYNWRSPFVGRGEIDL